MKIAIVAVAAVLTGGLAGALAGSAAAQDPSVPFKDRTERVQLEGRRGPSLFQPGFAIGEYVGFSRTVRSSMSVPFRRSGHASSSFSITVPGRGDVTGECSGGQARSRFLGVTFDRDDLAYNCDIGGAAPADADFSLVLGRGGFMARLQQPQRAAELTWNGRLYQPQTRYVDGLPWTGGGSTIGYVITRDGVDVGGVALSGLRPAFYLPPQGSPDRDPVAVMGAILFGFQDPGRNL